MAEYIKYKCVDAKSGVYKKDDCYLNYSRGLRPIRHQDFRSQMGINYVYLSIDEYCVLIIGNMKFNVGGQRVLINKGKDHIKVHDYQDFGLITGECIDYIDYDGDEDGDEYDVPIYVVYTSLEITHLNNTHTLIKAKSYPSYLVFRGLFTLTDDPIYTLQGSGKKWVLANSWNKMHLVNQQNTLDICPIVRLGLNWELTLPCPFDGSNHDSSNCRCFKFNCYELFCGRQMSNKFLYFVNCSDKIRLVDGKKAGQYTKPAAKMINYD
jgi:hypothetical protein